VEEISTRFPVNFVLHPATQSRLKKDKLFERLAANPQVALLPRMGYGDFLRLAAHAACVLTDGGSNQEELAALGVPTIIMRSRTERPDGLGTNSIMERDVDGGVAKFILHDRFEQLRRAPAQIATEGPSHRIAQFLANDA
jgi:UDP-N-acetylglucosamine 2-epimerase (non-hydrolysing)